MTGEQNPYTFLEVSRLSSRIWTQSEDPPEQPFFHDQEERKIKKSR
jgi:hypothetical protein